MSDNERGAAHDCVVGLLAYCEVEDRVVWRSTRDSAGEARGVGSHTYIPVGGKAEAPRGARDAELIRPKHKRTG